MLKNLKNAPITKEINSNIILSTADGEEYLIDELEYTTGNLYVN